MNSIGDWIDSLIRAGKAFAAIGAGIVLLGATVSLGTFDEQLEARGASPNIHVQVGLPLIVLGGMMWLTHNERLKDLTKAKEECELRREQAQDFERLLWKLQSESVSGGAATGAEAERLTRLIAQERRLHSEAERKVLRLRRQTNT